MSSQSETVIKAITLGDSAVGKSSLLLRFCQDKFAASYMTTVGYSFDIILLTLIRRGTLFKERCYR